MRSWQGPILGFLLLLVSAVPALSAPPVTVHVLAEPSPFSDVFVSSLTQELPNNLRMVDEPEAADVLVALGDAAFSGALVHGKPLLGIYVSRALSEDAERQGCQCAAVWAGVSLLDQLRMVHTMMPLARRVGVVMGTNSVWPIEVVRRHRGAIKLESLPVNNARDLGNTLRENLNHLDAIVLPVDDALLGPDAAKLVLLTSYRQRRPVFGPDLTFVNAGSVASYFASGSDLVSEGAQRLHYFANNRQWQASSFVVRPSVVVNEHVARGFDMRYRTSGTLQDALQDARALP
ncbi:hypothetical protein [Alcanivorax borkumensis]|uniref:ABC transporter substrate-binding protein n=1 Tax=Alcanivorax borkumensis (strain ATCC 700651 / DSM 11573 / NCIMB 13689 / SK2) TaxID=393595 RepID=Q0VNE6_ALCBS|nr:hypothetical protein [Alcanivorax borkumensis]CAL17302.1 conserved hypothetical protein [Alcanivorax borkumensis SK2]